MFMADLSIFNIPESGYNISDRICESIFARAPMDEWKMRPIGYIRSDYTRTDQVPKGLGATHTMEGTLEILPEYEKGLQDIEGYSHLLILWVFHQAFSTRSPRRPNPIGLTTVELIRREGASLFLRGIDMLDGTPVIDIKPYTSSIPMEQLRRGWLEEAEKRRK
jgi:tRNA (Thr-GGU) A37 N-methylase